MNKLEYLETLKTLLTDVQLERFNKCFPNGYASKLEIREAIDLIERTLKNLNKVNEDYSSLKQEFDQYKKESIKEIATLRQAVAHLQMEVDKKPIMIIDTDDVQFKLAKLQALENAGVDNWDGYDWAMEDFFTED